MTNIVDQEKNPKLFLEKMRRDAISQIDEIFKNMGVDVQEYFEELEKGKSVVKIDNAVDKKIREGLKRAFGSRITFTVSMEHDATPFLENGSKKNNEYRYTVRHVSWTNGPTMHQVFYYLYENFRYYLPSNEFKRSMFTRNLPTIERAHIEWFKPLEINGRTFKPIQIFKTLVIQKNIETDEVKFKYYIIDVVDKKLNIQNIRGETVADVLTNLQHSIEDIYYAPRYDPRKERLMELENTTISTPEPDSTGEVVDPTPAVPQDEQQDNSGGDNSDSGGSGDSSGGDSGSGGDSSEATIISNK